MGNMGNSCQYHKINDPESVPLDTPQHDSNVPAEQYGSLSAPPQTDSAPQDAKVPRVFSVPSSVPVGSKEKGDSTFCNNYVKTAKYSVVKFFPLFFADQFMKFANIYFAFMSVLVCVSMISPYMWYSTAAPFLFILFVAAVQEVYADSKRHAADTEANGRKTSVLKNGVWQDVKWQDINVGDLIEIKNNEQVPADTLILATQETEESDPDDVVGCQVDTAALDGETNKKEYECYPSTRLLRDEARLSEAKFKVEVDQPNSALYNLSGKLMLEGADEPLLLNHKNVLLREMTISGTFRVWGVVVYTGAETKIQKNNNPAQTKTSKAMHTLNRYIRYIFAAQQIICLMCAICAGVWFYDKGTDSWYLALSDEWSSSFTTNWCGTNNSALVGLASYFTFFILLGNMLPISLYVTIDSFIKFASGYFIDWDSSMFYETLQKGALCRNSTIIEETGQVQFVLSDKTGTLTQNKMQFLKCVINGQGYGQGATEVQKAQWKLDGTYDEKMKGAIDDVERVQKTAGFSQDDSFIFYDAELSGRTWCKGTAEASVRDYLRALALCNTVKTQKSESDGKIEYSAESPDDGALVGAAKNLGIQLVSRKKDGDNQQLLTVLEAQAEGNPKTVKYRLLETMQFSSYRKRMDVIVQTPEDLANGTVTVIVKGADSHVIDSCLCDQEREQERFKLTYKACSSHADQGLRTLFVAQGCTSLHNYNAWKKEYDALKARANELDKAEKDNEFDKIERMLEMGKYNPSGMRLLGSTALEEDVGDTLAMLRKGKIKTWVLTGDKVGTAIEIGTACELLTDAMIKTTVLEFPDPTQPQKMITPPEILDTIKKGLKKRMTDSDVEKATNLRDLASSSLLSMRAKCGTIEPVKTPSASAGQGIKEIDANGPGEVTKAEWIAANLGSADEFDELDLNRDGKLNMYEIAASKTRYALVIEGGALKVMGIGEKEDEWCDKALENARKAYNQVAARKPPDERALARATDMLDQAKKKTEQMRKLQIELINLASQCQAVLCCRVSPQQKGDVTRLVKTHLGKVTLGVGDGANDVDMITAAHVGVGIQGVEGSQAVNSADFALSQFKHLRSLLFVHGRWTYRRIARAVVYFFYKNMIPTLTILFYIIMSGFSGTGMYNEMCMSGYNLFFTSMPVIVFALMEQDLDSDKSLKTPILYSLGRNSELLNGKVFGAWIIESGWASLVIFIFTWYGCSSPVEDGHPMPQGQVSITMFTCVLLVVTYRLAIDTQFWTWIHWFFYVGSIALWFVFIMVECAVPAGVITDGTMYWDFYNLASNPRFYFILPLVTFSATWPSFLFRSYNRNYIPPAIVSRICPLVKGPNVVEQAQLELKQDQLDSQEEKDAKITRWVSKRRSTAALETELSGEVPRLRIRLLDNKGANADHSKGANAEHVEI